MEQKLRAGRLSRGIGAGCTSILGLIGAAATSSNSRQAKPVQEFRFVLAEDCRLTSEFGRAVRSTDGSHFHKFPFSKLEPITVLARRYFPISFEALLAVDIQKEFYRKPARLP